MNELHGQMIASISELPGQREACPKEETVRVFRVVAMG